MPSSKDLTRLRPAMDALSLTALHQELESTLLTGAVQRVEVRESSLTLEIYAHHSRRRLTSHVGDDAARIHLTVLKSEPGTPTESPMLLQLRKYVRGGRINAITQPRLERLIRLEITKRDDDVVRRCSLIIEMMGRRSNAILVDEDGHILEALRRTPPSRSPNRPILPRLPYTAPPPQDRLDPTDKDVARVLEESAQSAPSGKSAAEVLANTVMGFSPLAAREVTYRAFGSAEISASQVDRWEHLAQAASDLVREIDEGRWQAHVAFFDDAPIAMMPYASRWLQSSADVRLETYPTVSEAIEVAFASTASRRTTPRSALELVRRIGEALTAERRREGALGREIAETEDIERLRLYGEAILASLSTLPPGAESFEFNGLTVPLDPPRPPLEVSGSYFAEYRKRRDAQAHVPQLIEETRQRIEYLESLVAMAEATDAQSTHRQILRELEAFNGMPTRVPKRRASHQEPQPRRLDTPDGFTVLVGTNGALNERVTFKIAAPDDIWLHARGEPGAHVILRTAGRTPTAAAMQFAADLAAKHSRGRGNSSVPVDHTAVRHVRKIRGAPPGLVRYVNEQTIIGRPDAAE